MRASVEQHEPLQPQQLSADVYRLSDDDEAVNVHANMIVQAVARNIDIDSTVIEEELSGISEPLNVSVLFVLYSQV